MPVIAKEFDPEATIRGNSAAWRLVTVWGLLEFEGTVAIIIA